MRISDWTVDYGQGPKPCQTPHSWNQDVDVRWEGPAVYSTRIPVPESGGWLLFEGVSFAARVLIGNRLMCIHEGIWDAFKVPLAGYEGQEVEIRVEVLKNGGPTHPVREVASGFLPYVFHTFGGIWRGVWLCSEEPDLEPPAPPCRVRVDGTQIFVDGKPFYMRGVLTWGWYPELGRPNPDDEEIRREVQLMKEMGFTTCKFCLWVPSHRYFEILEEEGMFAWLELPLWDPTPDLAKQEAIFEELRRIVLQYRRHSNIVAWTCGCELSTATSAEYRKRLYEMVKEVTGAALVKDNSGSSEMYGGDLREYGDFYDFHPYCDTPFYPVVLDSLLNGTREAKPILLGEFNDIDTHRDLARIKGDRPYWASEDPYLNDQGVRWEPPPLPRILEESRWTKDDPENRWLRWNSEWKADYMRRIVHQAVRSRRDIAGYVITGWMDTPISTSGMVDIWGDTKELGAKHWNAPGVLFPIPSRRPPWVNGGNRPGWIDPWNAFEGDVHLRVGAVSERGVSATFRWELQRCEQEKPYLRPCAKGQSDQVKLEPNTPCAVAEICIPNLAPGKYVFVGSLGRLKLVETLWVFEKPSAARFEDWRLEDPAGHFFGAKFGDGHKFVATNMTPDLASAIRGGAKAVWIMLDAATIPAPFWREAAYTWPDADEFDGPVCHEWSRLISVSGDRAIDVQAVERALGAPLEQVHVDMLRIDTRTYAEAPILIRAKVGKGTLVATTLRPFGGLGVQPYGVINNPAGAVLLKDLMRLAEG